VLWFCSPNYSLFFSPFPLTSPPLWVRAEPARIFSSFRSGPRMVNPANIYKGGRSPEHPSARGFPQRRSPDRTEKPPGAESSVGEGSKATRLQLHRASRGRQTATCRLTPLIPNARESPPHRGARGIEIDEADRPRATPSNR